MWVRPLDASLRPQVPIICTACQGHWIKHSAPQCKQPQSPSSVSEALRRCLRCWSSTAWCPEHTETSREVPGCPEPHFWFSSRVTWPSTLECLVSELGQSALYPHLYLYSHHSHQLLEGTRKGFLKLQDLYLPNCQVRWFITNVPNTHFSCPFSSFWGSSFLCLTIGFSALPRLASQAHSWKRDW